MFDVLLFDLQNELYLYSKDKFVDKLAYHS